MVLFIKEISMKTIYLSVLSLIFTQQAVAATSLAERVSNLEARVERIESIGSTWSCQAYCGGYIGKSLQYKAITGSGKTASEAFVSLKCEEHLFVGVVSNALVHATLANACLKN